MESNRNNIVDIERNQSVKLDAQTDQQIRKELDELISSISQDVMNSTVNSQFKKQMETIKSELIKQEESHYLELKQKLKNIMIILSLGLTSILGVVLYILFLFI